MATIKSIEEKAKRYDDLLVKLQEAKEDNEVCDERYCCVIDGIVPELKESDGDKELSEILGRVIRRYINDPNIPYTEREKVSREIIPYMERLEKQGEHANFLNKIQIGDKVTRNEDGVLVNLSQLKRIAKPAEKQGENNMGISEATKKKLEGSLHKALEKETPESCNEFLEKQGEQNLANSAKTCKDEQKPVEWRPSKEVMDVLYSLCYVSDIMDEHKDTVLTKLYQELKREYFNSASYENMFPKEEKIKQSLTKWNEEDDKKLSSIIDLTNYAQDTWSKKYMIEVRDWLKSLKDRIQPQSTWKPDELQLKCLSGAISNYNKRGFGAPILKELLEQLKKLRKE